MPRFSTLLFLLVVQPLAYSHNGIAMAKMTSSLQSSEVALHELAKANHILAEDFRLDSLDLKVDLHHLSQILATDSFDFDLARLTHLAMTTVFDDVSDIESPMNIALIDLPENWRHSQINRNDAELARVTKRFLSQHLNQRSTQLRFYSGAEAAEFPPENGESPSENWIYILQIPSLSDHIYWIIIDKKGEQQPYVYGFN